MLNLSTMIESTETERTVDQFLTVKFKLHNPSQRKRVVMDYAMRQAHLAFDKVLRTVRDDVEAIVAISDKKERKTLRSALTKRMQDIMRPLPMGSGPKQAVIVDAGAQIDSYIALRDADKGDVLTGYPAAARLDQTEDEAYAIALDKLITSTTKQDEDEARDEMARARHAGTARPLGIYKNRVDDGMLILSDDNDRLFAYINLISSKSRYAHRVDMTGLIDTRTGEVMMKNAKPAQGVLVPLQSSVWHQRKFLENATLQSGKLIKEGDEYFIACSFKFSAPPRPDPVNYLGVDRGIEMLAAWSVINPDSQVIARGSHDGAGLRAVQRQAERDQADTQRKGKVYSKHTRLAAADIEVHACANAIVAAAIEHNARVVFEDLSAINTVST